MIKKRQANSRVLLSWLACLILIVLGCRTDDQPELALIPLEKRMIVKAQDIPDITMTLMEKLGLPQGIQQFSLHGQSDSESALAINWDKIMQLVDSTGRETYTFGISDNDNDISTFYNLILKFNEDGQAHKPFLLKYTMDPEFVTEFRRTRSMENFRGKIKKIFLDGIGSSPNTNNTAFLDNSGGVLLGSECPDDTEVGDDPSPGGGGNQDTGPDPGSGSSYECTTYIVTTTWYSQACTSDGCEAPVVVGIEESVVTECGWTTVNSSSDSSGDCVPTDEEIPILIPEDERCDDDPLAYMAITDYNSGRNANRFGCVRTGQTTCDGKKGHYGIDLVADINDNVHAMYGGTVLTSGTQMDGPLIVGWGHYIIIESTINGATHYFLYAHLDSQPTTTGTVSAGDIIGASGDSGNAGGEPHLHVEVRKPGADDSFNTSTKLDPEDFLGATFDEHGNTNWDVTCD